MYNALHGFELSEAGWESALLIELADRGLSAERQVEYALRYKGYRIGRFFIDVLVEDKLLLELNLMDSVDATPILLVSSLRFHSGQV